MHVSDQYTTTEQQASYGVGRQMGQQVADDPFDGLDKAALIAGLGDALEGRPFQVEPAVINAAFKEIQARMSTVQAAGSEAIIAEGEQFLAENAKRPEVTVTESGLQYEVLEEGSGDKPAATDKVRTHYHGTLIDGTVFDSSYERGEPAEFTVNAVIPGWTEALQMMPVGAKWRLCLPHNLAYGERGAGGAIKPFATLVFDVELLAIA